MVSVAALCLQCSSYVQAEGPVSVRLLGADLDETASVGDFRGLQSHPAPKTELGEVAAEITRPLEAFEPPDIKLRLIVDGKLVCETDEVEDSWHPLYSSTTRACPTVVVSDSTLLEVEAWDVDAISDELIGRCKSTGPLLVAKEGHDLDTREFACEGALRSIRASVALDP